MTSSMHENRDYWGTTDIDTAATLIACGHKLLDTSESRDRGKAGKMVFYFKNEEIKDTIMKYANHTLNVPPRRLFDALRMLKNLCHNVGYK